MARGFGQALAMAGQVTALLGAGVANARDGQRLLQGERYAPTIWIDPDGREHRVMDDGIEGDLTSRLDPYGKPVCSAVAPPNTAVGPFKSGSAFADLI